MYSYTTRPLWENCEIGLQLPTTIIVPLAFIANERWPEDPTQLKSKFGLLISSPSWVQTLSMFWNTCTIPFKSLPLWTDATILPSWFIAAVLPPKKLYARLSPSITSPTCTHSLLSPWQQFEISILTSNLSSLSQSISTSEA